MSLHRKKIDRDVVDRILEGLACEVKDAVTEAKGYAFASSTEILGAAVMNLEELKQTVMCHSPSEAADVLEMMAINAVYALASVNHAFDETDHEDETNTEEEAPCPDPK